MRAALQRLEWAVTEWLARNGVHLLRVATGVVFLWFGALKLIPGASPAEGLVERTVGWIVDPTWFLPVLAAWECAIGLGLLVHRAPRLTLLLLFLHMPGTFMPLIACPELVWTAFPFRWTLEGQYILKNLVLIGGALTLTGHLAVQRRAAERRSWDDCPDAVPIMRVSTRSRGRRRSTLSATRVVGSRSRQRPAAQRG